MNTSSNVAFYTPQSFIFSTKVILSLIYWIFRDNFKGSNFYFSFSKSFIFDSIIEKNFLKSDWSFFNWNTRDPPAESNNLEFGNMFLIL